MGFFKKLTGSEKAAETQSAPVAAAPAEDFAANEELIAVLTAAIAAYQGAAPSKLTVRKINRICGPVLAWNYAGRIECIDSRRV